MANPAYTHTEKNAVVAFAVLTGEGRNGRKKENEYTLAVEVTPKQKQKIIDEVLEFWDENKPKKANAPKEDPNNWFTESQSNKKNFVFWASEVVSKNITRKKAEGSEYGLKHFADLGSGSEVDAEYRFFMYDNEYGSGVSVRLSAVCLNKYVKYAGGGSSLDGDTLDDEGITEMKSAAAEDDKWDELIEDFNEAIEDEDWEDAEEALEELEDHEDYKKFKKALKKARK